MDARHPLFETAFGSVVGRTHSLMGRANQDAVVVRSNESNVALVVSDGCGSATHSEVGAWFFANVLATALSQTKGAEMIEPHYATKLQRQLLSHMQQLALTMGNDVAETVREYFLFTLIAAVIADDHAAVFVLGDGLVSINGSVSTFGPFAGNAPPYLGHIFMGKEESFTLFRSMRTTEVDSIVIATDGACEWDTLCHQCLPGENERVGPLGQFINEDKFFNHPDQLRRKLARMNRVVNRPDWEARRFEKQPALLEDDTTFATLRRRRGNIASAGAEHSR